MPCREPQQVSIGAVGREYNLVLACCLCDMVYLVLCRMLFMMGQLCRYGASIIDSEAAQNTSTRNCTECLELCVR